MPHRIEIVVADIATLDVDAIVNAANRTLLGGGGVDGAIHRAAGPELLAECRTLGGCNTGEAKITRGYKLKARHVIHTVGPVWEAGGADEDRLLASCYASSLALAKQHGLRTIAFPAISTGVYGFPADRAATIAVKTVAERLDGDERRSSSAAFRPPPRSIMNGLAGEIVKACMKREQPAPLLTRMPTTFSRMGGTVAVPNGIVVGLKGVRHLVSASKSGNLIHGHLFETGSGNPLDPRALRGI